jgi:hypothetical protein
MRRVIVLYGVAPIPVQHRVEVFGVENLTIFGHSVGPRIGDWAVYDHSTGIWYGSSQYFDVSDDPVPGTYWPSFRKDLRFTERFTGVVAACIVIGDRSTSSTACPTQTTLHVDVP